MTVTMDAKASGVYPVELRMFRRRRFTILVFHRNFEIDCPKCLNSIHTLPLSVVRAAFGVKQACDWCGHRFIFHYEDPTAGALQATMGKG